MRVAMGGVAAGWEVVGWAVGAWEVAGWEAEGEEGKEGACGHGHTMGRTMASTVCSLFSSLRIDQLLQQAAPLWARTGAAHPGEGGCGVGGGGGLGGRGGGAQAWSCPQPTRIRLAALGSALEAAQRAVSTDSTTLPPLQLTVCWVPVCPAGRKGHCCCNSAAFQPPCRRRTEAAMAALTRRTCALHAHHAHQACHKCCFDSKGAAAASGALPSSQGAAQGQAAGCWVRHYMPAAAGEAHSGNVLGAAHGDKPHIKGGDVAAGAGRQAGRIPAAHLLVLCKWASKWPALSSSGCGCTAAWDLPVLLHAKSCQAVPDGPTPQLTKNVVGRRRGRVGGGWQWGGWLGRG